MNATEGERHRVFLFADLAGYTALTEAMGGAEAARIVARYAALAEQALGPGAKIAERVGDEILVVTDDAASAITSAVSLRAAVDAEAFFPSVRAGIHGGPVIERDGRYFGAALNLAARVAAYARSGQILCTAPIATATDLPGISCRRLGPVRFRHVTGAVEVFEVMESTERRAVLMIDPVCRMQLHPESAPARLPFAGATYYFCSFECARRFAHHPDGYVTP